MHQSGENFMSLADAARIVGTTASYLNVLVHRGKLTAKKIGRNWVTTPTWLNQYLNGGKRPELTHSLELEKLWLDHELELVKIQNKKEIQLREIEKAEKQALAGNQEQDDRQILEQEKQALAEFFTHQLEQIKQQLNEVDELKQELQQATQLRVNELIQDWHEKENISRQMGFLKESFSQALEESRRDSESSLQQRIHELTEEVNNKLEESTISEVVEEMRGRFVETDLTTALPPQNNWRLRPLHAAGIHHIAKPKSQNSLLSSILVGATAVALILLVGYAGGDTIGKLGTEKLYFAELGEEWSETFINTAMSTRQLFNTPLIDTSQTNQQIKESFLLALTRAKNSFIATGIRVAGANTEKPPQPPLTPLALDLSAVHQLYDFLITTPAPNITKTLASLTFKEP